MTRVELLVVVVTRVRVRECVCDTVAKDNLAAQWEKKAGSDTYIHTQNARTRVLVVLQA